MTIVISKDEKSKNIIEKSFNDLNINYILSLKI